MGRYKYLGSKKRVFLNTWVFGKRVAKFINTRLKGKKESTLLVINFKNINFKSFRFAALQNGLKDLKLKPWKINLIKSVAYNGCRKKKFGRTGRKKMFFF